MSSGETIEELLEEIGGLGKFQVLIIAAVFYNKFPVSWSILQMSFAGLIPDFYCLTPDTVYEHGNFSNWNTTLNSCHTNNYTTKTANCEQYKYTGTQNTIINEWDLVCDKSWVKKLVISIQMAGVLIGAFVAGYLGDYFGRKKTMYGFVSGHAVINIITAYSMNWEMFAVCRFFIGLGIGGVLVMVFPYPIEFLPSKWRPILAIVPIWSFGVCIFALSAALLEDWSRLHLVCGLCAIPGLAGYFIVPESLRWLTVQGRVKEAVKVAEQIAIINNKPLPDKCSIILEKVAQKEHEARANGQKYSYIDVFRGWYSAKISIIFSFHWFALSLIYYGIAFGVSALAGNIYVNILLLSVVEIPAQLSTCYFNIKIGRKWTSFMFLTIGLLSAVLCVIVKFTVTDSTRDNAITGLSLVAKMGLGASWGCIQIWGIELYPTVTRNLGHGLMNTAARIGGILAPYVIDFDNMLVVSYIIIAALMLICLILIVITPETQGTLLADSVKSVMKESALEEGQSMKSVMKECALEKGQVARGVKSDSELDKRGTSITKDDKCPKNETYINGKDLEVNYRF